MHHNEIGQMMELMEDFSLFTDAPTPVDVKTYARKDCSSGQAKGLQLTVQWLQCKLVTEIDDCDRDSDVMRFYFYCHHEQPKPDLSLIHTVGTFQIESVRVFLRSLVQVSKNKLNLSELQDENFFRGTVIQHIKPNGRGWTPTAHHLIPIPQPPIVIVSQIAVTL